MSKTARRNQNIIVLLDCHSGFAMARGYFRVHVNVSVYSQTHLILLTRQISGIMRCFFALTIEIHSLYYTHCGCLDAVPRSEKLDKMQNEHTKHARTTTRAQEKSRSTRTEYNDHGDIEN